MRHLAALLVFALGCGPDGGGGRSQVDGGGDGGPTAIPGLTAIAVTPASATFTVVDGVAQTGDFKATGTFLDGHTEDVTDRVAWSLADGSLGSVDAKGRYTTTTVRGGSTKLNASDGVQTGSAMVSVTWKSTRVSQDDGSTAPADSATKFAGPMDAALAPEVVYPLSGALVPLNLGELEIQWKKPAGPADLFEVALTAPGFELRVYTNTLKPNGGRLLLTPAEWNALAATVAGGAVDIAVRGASTQAGSYGAGAPVKLKVGKDEVHGGLYYWAAAGAGGAVDGIYRHEFGQTGMIAQPFYTRDDGNAAFNDGKTDHCVACHVLSRDGTKMAITYNGGDGPAAMLDVATKAPIVPLSQKVAWNFAALSPDGNRLVASRDGVLKIYDVSGGPMNGMVLSTVDTGGFATHPDWSPRGDKIVFARGSSKFDTKDWHLVNGSIVEVTETGGIFGNPIELVKASGNDNNYYPSYSPDGAWVLFNRASNTAENGSYNAEDARLFVVRAQPDAKPIALSAANAVGALTNSWARWAPFVQKNGEHGDLFYFTFSSTRDYGIEVGSLNPDNPKPNEPKRPQIWMAAFDPFDADQEQDPSDVPFWLPFQNTMTNNHIAQWTERVVGIK